ncbi:ACT domain-containing protein isoform 2 [Capsicum annuum]|nr:ACT domain-containing protein isoform 2 [Capsicum annuum]
MAWLTDRHLDLRVMYNDFSHCFRGDGGLDDVSTDGIWCYVVLWVVPHYSSSILRWINLKERLLSVCPSCSVSFYLNEPSPRSASSPVYLLTFCSRDRRGLLHDVTQVLCELELTIQRVKETTTPDDRVLDILFITELANKELGLNTAGWVGSSYTQERQDETYTQLHAVLGQSCSCEIQLAGPQYDNLLCSSLSPSVSEELFRCKPSDNEFRTQALSPDMTQLKKSSVTIDNSFSPGHTLLQIGCLDHKGFLYDIIRTLKDCNIQLVPLNLWCNIRESTIAQMHQTTAVTEISDINEY